MSLSDAINVLQKSEPPQLLKRKSDTKVPCKTPAKKQKGSTGSLKVDDWVEFYYEDSLLYRGQVPAKSSKAEHNDFFYEKVSQVLQSDHF